MNENLTGEPYPLQNYYSRIYKTYDLVNSLFTLGLDKKWRRLAVRECLAQSPERVLDLCCGTGDLAIDLSVRKSGNTTVIGYDLNREMLEIARRKAEKMNVSPAFIRGDAASMPFSTNEFDCIIIGFGFRNLTWHNPARDTYISEMHRVLRPGGSVFILESARPANILVRWVYGLYLKYILVPLGGLLSGDWNAYRYLAGSSSGYYTFKELSGLLAQFGFELKMKKKFLMGSANLLEAIKLRSD